MLVTAPPCPTQWQCPHPLANARTRSMEQEQKALGTRGRRWRCSPAALPSPRQLPWSPPEKPQFLNPDLSLTVGKVPLSQVSFIPGFMPPKVYSDAVSYESMFYFILKYHEWYFSHLLKEIHQTLKTEQTTVKATNTEISTKQMLKKTKTKNEKLNFLLQAWDISKTST